MNYKLYRGDCLEVMNVIPDKSIDMILCDLPYGTTACKWDIIIPFEPLWEQYKRIIKDNGAIVLFASQPFTSLLIASNLKKYKHCWVWNKKFAANFVMAKYQPLKIHEDIIVFGYNTVNYYPQKTQRDIPIKLGKNVSKSGSVNLAYAKDKYKNKIYNDKNPESILFFNTRAEGQKKLHQTQKPVELCEYLIKTYTNEGETVLDNCMGSGSTGVAARNTGRFFIGVEKEDYIFEIAKKRIEDLN